MRNLLLAGGLGLVLSLGGCSRGGEPALNPAADSPDDKGTGGP